MKKIFAMVLVAILMMAMGSAAFAADPDYLITITGGVKGETYSAYKMFDLSVDDPTNPTAFRYTVNPAWAEFATTTEFQAVFTVDDQGYVTSTKTSTTTWSATSDLSKVADAAAKFAKDHSIPAKASVPATADGNVTLNVGEAGYYVIASTLGSRAMIETTPDKTAVTINEKNEKDTIEKTVKEDSGTYGTSNDAQIGDTVEFKSVANIVPRSVNVKIHDTMDSGLTLNPSSIKIYTDEALTTAYTGATINTGTNAAAGDTFTIIIPDTFAATATAAQKLYIVYTAEVNQNAIVKDTNGVAIVDQNNKTSK